MLLKMGVTDPFVPLPRKKKKIDFSSSHRFFLDLETSSIPRKRQCKKSLFLISQRNDKNKIILKGLLQVINRKFIQDD